MIRWQADPDRRERQRPRTGSGAAARFVYYAARNVREIFSGRHLSGGGARAAQMKLPARNLTGDGPGDLPARGIGAADGERRIDLALDFHPQGPPDPPRPGVSMDHAAY
jgi:hypothetical protein